MRMPALLALLIAAAAQAQPPVPAPGQAVPMTLQQRFDAATAALDASDWPGALAQFEAIEARAGNARTLAIVGARKATALVELGRLEEASAALRLALTALPADDPALREDRFLGLRTLGRIAELELDYPEALRQYRLAAAIPVTDGARLLVQRGIIQTQLFTDAEGAVRDADAALRLAAAVAPDNRRLAGQIHTLKGRALLNLGRHTQAREELEAALRLLGNLTTRVDQDDLLARSDLAIAALLTGRPDDARRYLVYTGAGRFYRGAIRGRQSNEPPRCGPEIAPEDVAVVEVFVGADGSVVGVVPIYASRQGPGAIAFAHAVSRWSFDPKSASEVPLLFRSVVRLELRCSLAPPRDRYAADPLAELRRLFAADPAWAPTLSGRLNRSPDLLRRELAALDQAGDPLARAALPLLLLLARHASLPSAEREVALRRALAMAAEQHLPPTLIAAIAIALSEELRERDSASRLDFQSLLALPQIRDTPEAAGFVRLSQAMTFYGRGELDDALAIATAVRALPEARRGGLLEAEALKIQAAIYGGRGDMTAARAADEARGPNAGRCGLGPRRNVLSTRDTDFPSEARRWGFEGWATLEVTAMPDGGVASIRTVVAYPPFVFSEAAHRIMRRARYAPFYARDGAACVTGREPVSFLLR